MNSEKKYCEFLKGKLADIESAYNAELADYRETYDERDITGDTFTLLCEDADKRRKEEVLNLYATAFDRNVTAENLQEVFGDDYEWLQCEYY